MASHDQQLKRVLELDEVSGRFEIDETGYTRFYPSSDEYKDANRWLSTETDIAEDEYRPLYEEAAENIAVYKASKTADMIDGEQAIIPLPVARIAVDQLVAWEVNTVMRPKPILSLQPAFKDQYDVIIPVPADMAAQFQASGMMPPGGATTIKKSAEETAAYAEAAYEFKLRDRKTLRFRQFIQEAFTDMATVSKCYGKVCREQTTRSVFQPKKVNGAFVDTLSREEVYVTGGDEIHWYGVPYFNMLKRLHDDDLDEADMVQERTACSSDKFLARCLEGEYFLIEEEEAEQLSRIVGETKPDAQRDVEATTQNKASLLPRNSVDVRLVWFYRYLKFKDQDGKKVIRRVSLMGDYHHGARRLCNIFRNPYDHQLRPYAVGYQFKDPHSDSGSCLTSISKCFQKASTHLMQSEMKNKFLANNWVPWCDPTADCAAEFTKGIRLVPGKPIMGVYGKDWGVAPIGANHDSVVPLLNVIRAMAREAQNMSGFESGDQLPGRTPSGAIAQILQQGLQQPYMLLQGADDFVSRMVMLDMETRRQFQPLGEIIPTRDPVTKAATDILFRFPMGEVARNFRISLTAVDEAMAQEHEPEQLMMLLNLWQQLTEFVGQLLEAMKSGSPGERKFFMRIVEGAQALFDRVIELSRTDKDIFNLRDAVAEIQAEVEQMQQLIEEQRIMEEQSAANQVANPAAAIPGPGVDAFAGGPVGLAGQPGNADGAAPPPEAGVPVEGVIQ